MKWSIDSIFWKNMKLKKKDSFSRHTHAECIEMENHDGIQFMFYMEEKNV